MRLNKDGNEQYRKGATLDLRMFIERFAKDLSKAQTGGTVSKRYENKAWNELLLDLEPRLRRIKNFRALPLLRVAFTRQIEGMKKSAA